MRKPMVRRPGRPNGRPRRQPKPLSDDLARKMLRRMDDLSLALLIFGRRACAEELVRRYREHCRTTGREYSRDHAIKGAAKIVGMDERTLANWVNRARLAR
jgi:hypothetical protein